MACQVKKIFSIKKQRVFELGNKISEQKLVRVNKNNAQADEQFLTSQIRGVFSIRQNGGGGGKKPKVVHQQ
jgi:hypothetical protein